MHGWKLCESHEEKNRPNWYFSRGITGSPYTGPIKDHTTGSGTSRYFKNVSKIITWNLKENIQCYYIWLIPSSGFTLLLN